MSGEKSLKTILADLRPRLREETFVFCTLPEKTYGALSDAEPFASVAEDEGLTVIVTQHHAYRAGLSYDGTFRCITLQVHSSLEAVGLTAAVSSALAAAAISANMVAGYFHDHVFIPSGEEERALKALKALHREP